MMHFNAFLLAALLSGCVSAFAPPVSFVAPGVTPRKRVNSELASSIEQTDGPAYSDDPRITLDSFPGSLSSFKPATPATNPEIFFQNRIVEPANVESVPAAVEYLSEAMKNKTSPYFESYFESSEKKEEFLVNYRASFLYNAEVEKRPELDLSGLKKIDPALDDILDNRVVVSDSQEIKVDAGVTVNDLAKYLRLSGSPILQKLFVPLPALAMTIKDAAFDPRFEKFHQVVSAVHVSRDGTIVEKSRDEIDEEKEIVVNIVLRAPGDSVQPASSTGILARWYAPNTKIDPLLGKELLDALTKEEGKTKTLAERLLDIKDTEIILHKFGRKPLPDVTIFVDGDEVLFKDDLLKKSEWIESIARNEYEYYDLQNRISEQIGWSANTASAKLKDDYTDELTVKTFVENFKKLATAFEENIVVKVENKNEVSIKFDAKFEEDVKKVTKDSFDFTMVEEEEEADTILSVQDQDQTSTPPDLGPMFSYQVRPEQSVYQVQPLVQPIQEQPQGLTVKKGTVIEDFKGEIFDTGRTQFEGKRRQYATTTFNNEMKPSLVVYPVDEKDVELAINYAARPENSYNVIGRAGGHQYSGVSCDNGALIISMDNFRKLEQSGGPKDVTGPDGVKHDVSLEVRVGTGVKLREFADFMRDEVKGTIPHGECPTVGMGGHAQSGGLSHIARSFGLAIDYVYGFRIVTADGKVREVNRDSTTQEDKDLYWAVLGGSPGAFGITTEVIFHPILDKDHPHCEVFTAVAPYYIPTTKISAFMKPTLEILEDFTNRARGPYGNKKAISDDLDLMVSLSGKNANHFGPRQDQDSIEENPSYIVFELVCKDTTDEVAGEQFQEIINEWRLNPLATELKVLGETEKKTISEINHLFTRKTPSVTISGRESPFPYVKRCYGSKGKLKEGWSEAYANLLDQVVAAKENIGCIFQVVVGGGKYSSLGKRKLDDGTFEEMTAFSHRDVQLHGIVFDLFREADEADKADDFIEDFENDVVDKFMKNEGETRIMHQWASSGDLDMNKKEVWEKYIDSEAKYNRLRDIKTAVDPDDVFSSRFSIRPWPKEPDADTPGFIPGETPGVIPGVVPGFTPGVDE